VAAYKDEKLVRAALADPDSAPLPERVRATLHFLRKLTLEPQAIGADDVRALHAVGVDDEAIEEAVYVATCFNTIDRLADAFDFRPNDARGLRWVQRILLKVGYKAGSIPG
jgi:alkylhydroperoxidase family enzyme